MKIQHLLVFAVVVFTTSCDTPRNTTRNQTTVATPAEGPALATSSIVVPESIKSAFTTRYPQAMNAKWSKYEQATVPIDWDLTDWPALDNEDYVVKYTVGPDLFFAWYDSGGNWIGSSMKLTNMSSLPAAVNNLIASKYAGYTVSSANMEYWKDRSAYEIELKSSGNKVKLLVDPNGNVIKEKTKTD